MTGTPKVISEIKFLRIGGTYILLGAIYPDSNLTIDSSEMTKCLNISDPVYLQKAIELVQKSKHKYPFRKIVDPVFDGSGRHSLNSSLRPAIRPSL